jgi:hypothetical protein
MSEFAEIFGIVNGKTAEEECTVEGELFGKNAISRLKRLYSLYDCVQIDLGIIVSGRAECEGDDGVLWMRGTEDALIACGQVKWLKCDGWRRVAIELE